MFGKNEIVGKKYFENYEENTLKVTSVFYTLQGEGPFSGMPAIFIRLSKCNLACKFCDTYFDDGDILTFDELCRKIHQSIKNYHPNKNVDDVLKKTILVLTGGEPLLQKNVCGFISKYSQTFRDIQIESNGLVYQEELPENTVLVVSPKCMEKSGQPIKYLMPNKKVIERANCLKFVMESDTNSPYSKIPEWAFDWLEKNNHRKIYVSPMNIYNIEPRKLKELKTENNILTIEERSNIDEVVSFWTPGLLNMEANQKNHEYTAKYCMENNLTLNLQMHLYASLA